MTETEALKIAIEHIECMAKFVANLKAGYSFEALGEDMWNIKNALATQPEISRLQAWVNDLQSDMYINCVYCGHRYGPNDKVPASMADVLKAHVEQCPKHPMSALKAEIQQIKAQADEDFETIGQMVDQLDAVTYSAKLPVPAATHVEGLLGTIIDVRDKLKKFVVEKSGENPWEDAP